MSPRNKGVFGWLGMAALIVVLSTLVALNWEDLRQALGAQSEKARVTLFRWGELMSIGDDLKDRYGTEPEVTYDTGADGRILSIAFSDYRSPEEQQAAAHALEIATFAVGRTKKSDQIDVVRVLFQPPAGTGESAGGSGPFSFALDDLTPAQPQTD